MRLTEKQGNKNIKFYDPLNLKSSEEKRNQRKLKRRQEKKNKIITSISDC